MYLCFLSGSYFIGLEDHPGLESCVRIAPALQFDRDSWKRGLLVHALATIAASPEMTSRIEENSRVQAVLEKISPFLLMWATGWAHTQLGLCSAILYWCLSPSLGACALTLLTLRRYHWRCTCLLPVSASKSGLPHCHWALTWPVLYMYSVPMLPFDPSLLVLTLAANHPPEMWLLCSWSENGILHEILILVSLLCTCPY